MNFCSPQFLCACCIAPIFFYLLAGKWLRQLFLSILNLVFLWTFVSNTQSWFCYAGFILGTYSLIWLVRKRPSGYVVVFGLISVLVTFLVFKKYTFLYYLIPQKVWLHHLSMIGLSYMLFKYIHVLIDTWQGQLDRCTLFSYVNYQLSFFTLVVGPIQRYNDFNRYWDSIDSSVMNERGSLLAWNRLLSGMIKLGFIATIALDANEIAKQNLESRSSDHPLRLFFVLFYTYAIYLYFNFSGYMDVVIGAAKLFGFELPENFNRPYLARNMVDFWNRWHITLTHWIRDYVFMTSYKLAAENVPQYSKSIGYFLLFISLFIAGVWHGSTANFAIFGIIHGFGAMVSQIYGDFLKWKLGRVRYQLYLKNEWIRGFAIVVTFHYFCFSLLFFALNTNEVFDILEYVGSQLAF